MAKKKELSELEVQVAQKQKDVDELGALSISLTKKIEEQKPIVEAQDAKIAGFAQEKKNIEDAIVLKKKELKEVEDKKNEVPKLIAKENTADSNAHATKKKELDDEIAKLEKKVKKLEADIVAQNEIYGSAITIAEEAITAKDVAIQAKTDAVVAQKVAEANDKKAQKILAATNADILAANEVFETLKKTIKNLSTEQGETQDETTGYNKEAAKAQADMIKKLQNSQELVQKISSIDNDKVNVDQIMRILGLNPESVQ